MLLLDAGISPERFHILGIDINSEAIEKARKGIYRERSLHRLPPEMCSRYFTRIDDKYALCEKVTRCVSFRCMNIFESAFLELGAFDIVFSRNMLIYFDRETKIEAKQRLEGRLRDNTSRIFFGHADLGGTGLYHTT
jgi:chemotaxis protein methyltransferase CheR